MSARGTPEERRPATGSAGGGLLRKASVAALSILVLLALGGTAKAAPGDLDLTFDGDGRVTASFGHTTYADALALQSDDKVLVGGQACDYSGDPWMEVTHCRTFLARYSPDGSLDASFGDGGRTMAELGLISDLAVLPEGKIVAAGTASGDFFLARFEADGTLDASFGDGGKVVTDFEGRDVEAAALEVLPDGKFVIAGRSRVPGTEHDLVVLTRYGPDGSLDTGFGTGGRVISDFEGDMYVSELALLRTGKLVVTGSCRCDGRNSDFGLVRYDANGSLDESFGEGGIATTNFGTFDYGSAYSVAVQPDGKLVAAGYSYRFDGSTGRDFTLVRYRADGSEDETFGTGGTVISDLTGGEEQAEDVAIQTDGKIVAAGASPEGFTVARYRANGSLDDGFGSGGKATAFGDDLGYADDLALQPDDKVVTAGRIGGCSRLCYYDLALARFDGGPANSAPVTVGRSVDAREDTAKKITLKGTDADGDGLTFKISDTPNHGALGRIGEVSCSDTGLKACFAKVSYRPGRNFNGVDSFAFRVSDGTAISEEARVTLSVKAVNDAPVAGDDRATTRKNERVRLNALTNDSDPDGNRLTIKRFTGGSHGEVRCSMRGRCVYVPDRGFRGRDTFTYKVKDGRGGTDTATVKIKVGGSR
jgi:uncharacterized delta-60 repeat protein